MTASSNLGDPSAGLEQQGFVERQLRVLSTTSRRLIATPLGTLLTIAVIAISLALPATFFKCVSSLQDLGLSWRGHTRVTIYLEQNIDDATGAAMAQAIAARKDVSTAVHIGKEQAAQDFAAWTGYDDLLASLDDNPLPGAIVIEPAIDLSNESEVEKLGNSLLALDGIEGADMDIRWLERLNAVLRLINTGIAIVASLLAVAVVITIGNTLRLDMQARREEIHVAQLVGATDQFVQKPFIFTGMLYGFFGGLLAAILTTFALALLNKPVAALAAEYQSSFELSGIGLAGFAALVCCGVVLGLFGAWLSARQHIYHR
ncbi:MAG: permease-like cell division protein FtsX [Granulosicoccaceae bacterium]